MAEAKPAHAFGVDVGGSGIKGGVVDLAAGDLVGERYRLDTPEPSTPDAVAKAIGEVVAEFNFAGEVGVTFPAVIKDGVAMTASNVDKSWIGTDVRAAVGAQVPGPVEVINDADAAGLAEMRYGAAKGENGIVLMLTFGTGIGSALFYNGVLIPNTEFGHIEVNGHVGEHTAAAPVKESKGWSWEEWAHHVNRYLHTLEKVVWPDLIVVGGGVSRRAHKWLDLLDARSRIVPATLQNNAGIVGAALAAREDRGM